MYLERHHIKMSSMTNFIANLVKPFEESRRGRRPSFLHDRYLDNVFLI
jgi:hypothetical protein